MTDGHGIKQLRFALLQIGLFFVFGLYPLALIWPSGWVWHAGQPEYLQMILAIYATLGMFLILASRDPLAHRSLIWFTVWSSVVHGVVMAAQVAVYPQHIGHLWGDVPALFLAAGILAFRMQRVDASASKRIV